MIIGITGSFGSGKTAVANIFRRYGFKVIDADKLYHDEFYKNHPLRSKIKKEFGTLDRNELKKIVFGDYSKLGKLNKITHPMIIKAMKKEIKKIEKANKGKSIKNKSMIKKNNAWKSKISGTNSVGKKIKDDYNKKNNSDVKIVVDIPLLFEAKVEKLFDKIIVVKASKKTQIKRILKKGKYSKKEIGQIIKSQMPLKEKIKRAHFVINNNNIIKNTENQIKKIVNSL